MWAHDAVLFDSWAPLSKGTWSTVAGSASAGGCSPLALAVSSASPRRRQTLPDPHGPRPAPALARYLPFLLNFIVQITPAHSTHPWSVGRQPHCEPKQLWRSICRGWHAPYNALGNSLGSWASTIAVHAHVEMRSRKGDVWTITGSKHAAKNDTSLQGPEHVAACKAVCPQDQSMCSAAHRCAR